MATLQQLEDALRKADAAGAVDDARMLANEIVRMRQARPAPEVRVDERSGMVFKDGQVVYDPSKDPTNVTDPTQGMSTIGKLRAGAGGKFNRAGLAIKDLFVGADEELAAARERDRPLYDTTAGGLGGLVTDVAMSVPALAAGGAIAAPLGMGAAATRFAAPAIGGALEMGLLKGTVGEEDRKRQAAGGATLGLLGEAVSRPLARVGKSLFGRAQDEAVRNAEKFGYYATSLAGGKSKTGQAVESFAGDTAQSIARYRNQANTDKLAKKALGIELDDPLQTGISQMKRAYGEAINEIKAIPEKFSPDAQLAKDLEPIMGAYKEIVEAVPASRKRQLEAVFMGEETALNANQLVDLSRFLRDRSKSLMNDSQALNTSLGMNFRKAQQALDDFLGRKVGGKLGKKFNEAKTKYAIASAVEDAARGEHVDAQKLAKLMSGIRSKSPELNAIRDAAEALPSITQFTPATQTTSGIAAPASMLVTSAPARALGQGAGLLSPAIRALGQQQSILGMGTPAQAGILGLGLGQE